MIQYRKGGIPQSPVNTTINAIMVVDRYPLGRKLFQKHIKTIEIERGIEKMPSEEFYERLDRLDGTEMDLSRYVVRVTVCENPYARIPLDRDLFCGPFDERYGGNGESGIGRVFAGDQVSQFDEPFA